jgi:hypothetical protein
VQTTSETDNRFWRCETSESVGPGREGRPGRSMR